MHGLLLTRDAVTTSGNVWPFFAATLVILLTVGVAAVFVLRAMSRRWTALDSDEMRPVTT